MTTRARQPRRGQPLIVLAAILMSWVAVRAAIWQAPFDLPERAVNERWAYRDGERTYIPLATPLPRTRFADLGGQADGNAGVDKPGLIARVLESVGLSRPKPVAPQSDAVPVMATAEPADGAGAGDLLLPEDGPGRTRLILARGPDVAVADPPVAPTPAPASTPVKPMSPRVMAGHQMLFLAAVADLPLPEVILRANAASAAQDAAAGPAPAPALVAVPAALAPPAVAAAPGLAARPVTARRWSADGWLMLRRGGTLPAGGPALATYGASQIGAVVRYRLDPASAHRPAAYMRASAALNGSGEREVAAGLAVRPIAALPVAVMAELRASRLSSRVTRARPAVLAVTELPPVQLPGGLRGEAYVQAGYVGGAAAIAFVDGQIRADRVVARIGAAELRAGGGMWGGAQQGASRLDVGPQATLGMSEGPAAARVALDWRFRLAGKAAPASGPALTVSAGF
ncbi:MAG: hypothetical protein KGL44_06385 [Sphingomonadales bacterium]|nr:hypothetical protein [Sphingomonadales bacterium]